MAVAPVASAADGVGVSAWDKKLHPNPYKVVLDILQKISNDANGTKNPSDGVKTASPIKHVIILIGENRGLDHTFGVYKPKGQGQTISNLLSKGIVNEDDGDLFHRQQEFGQLDGLLQRPAGAGPDLEDAG